MTLVEQSLEECKDAESGANVCLLFDYESRDGKYSCDGTAPLIELSFEEKQEVLTDYEGESLQQFRKLRRGGGIIRGVLDVTRYMRRQVLNGSQRVLSKRY